MLDPRRRRLQAGRLGPRNNLVRDENRRQIDIADRLAKQRVAHRAADDARGALAGHQRSEHRLQVLVLEPGGLSKGAGAVSLIHGPSP